MTWPRPTNRLAIVICGEKWKCWEWEIIESSGRMNLPVIWEPMKSDSPTDRILPCRRIGKYVGFFFE
jgi:hypothetical protein